MTILFQNGELEIEIIQGKIEITVTEPGYEYNDSTSTTISIEEAKQIAEIFTKSVDILSDPAYQNALASIKQVLGLYKEQRQALDESYSYIKNLEQIINKGGGFEFKELAGAYETLALRHRELQAKFEALKSEQTKKG